MVGLSRAKRAPTWLEKTNGSNACPGSYEIATDVVEKSRGGGGGGAPFGSTLPQSAAQTALVTPGPHTYRPDKVRSEAAQGFSLGSKGPRFAMDTVLSKLYTPGPGTYAVASSLATATSAAAAAAAASTAAGVGADDGHARRRERVRWERTGNPPSIPAADTHGYEEQGGRLVRVPRALPAGDADADATAAGAAEAKPQAIKGAVLNTTGEQHPCCNTVPREATLVPGPGAYNPERGRWDPPCLWDDASGRPEGSAVFRSISRRVLFQDQSRVPGPGAYEASSSPAATAAAAAAAAAAATAAPQRTAGPPATAFGSTVLPTVPISARRQQQNPPPLRRGSGGGGGDDDDAGSVFLAPCGSHPPPSSSDEYALLLPPTPPTQQQQRPPSKQPRSTLPKAARFPPIRSEAPGPGAYGEGRERHSGIGGASWEPYRRGAFGSTAARFAARDRKGGGSGGEGEAEPSGAGPGDYTLRYPASGVRNRERRQAVFVRPPPRKEPNPAALAVQLKASGVVETMQPEAAEGAAGLFPRAPVGPASSSLSKDKRFKHSERALARLAGLPGPGAYTLPAPVGCGGAAADASGDAKFAFGSEPRFAGPRVTGPNPCSYIIPDSIVRRTFNATMTGH